VKRVDPRHVHRLDEPPPTDWREAILAPLVLVGWFVILVYGLPIVAATMR
jgi:hypothetical protein